MRSGWVGWVAMLLACAACASEEAPAPAATPAGPGEVQVEAVQRHAAQFTGDLASRPAGSQQELAAATYILGHLQQAGYVPLLDAVPVGDLVRSTNVVAPPPEGDDPTVVVAIPYDTAPGAGGGGLEIGLFLELARAMRVREPEHSVSFVAMGAEHSRDHLGSRRLAKFLLDEDLDPLVVTFEVGAGDELRASGNGASDFLAGARSLGLATDTSDTDPVDASVFVDAGFAHMVTSGDAQSLGLALLEFLSTPDR